MAYQQQQPHSSFVPQPSHPPQTSQSSSLVQQYENTATTAMPPPQRPYQQIPNPLTAAPTASSTNSPPRGQQAVKITPIPTPSMTAAAPITSAQTTPTSDTSGKPSTPKTGSLSTLDQERVASLLNLNAIILRELQTLQTAGANNQPGQPSPNQPNPAGAHPSTTAPSAESQKSPTGAPSTTPTTTTSTPQTPKPIKPPPKYIFDNYLKRLQVNIAYLLALSQGKPVPPHPLAMEPPPDSWSHIDRSDGTDTTEKFELEEKGKKTAEEFREAYAKLKELWPNYRPGVRVAQQAPVSGGQGQSQHAPGTQGQGQVPPVQAPVPHQAHQQQQQQQASQHQQQFPPQQAQNSAAS